MLKEVRFRYQHEGCWLQDATLRFPGLTLITSGHYVHEGVVNCTVTAHAPRAETLAQALADWRRDTRILRILEISAGPRGASFHVRYKDPASIFHLIPAHSPVSYGSIRHGGGEEHYSVVGQSQDLEALVQAMAKRGRLELDSIAPAEQDDAAAGAWGGLTQRQVEAVLVAYGAGYYQWPRQVSVTAIAQARNEKKSAFLDNLRRAEGKIMTQQVGQFQASDPARAQALLAAGRRLMQ